jgi:S1-C subfamily serine protease
LENPVWLTIRSGKDAGRKVSLGAEGLTIGREGGGCDLVLADSRVSRRHASLEPRAGSRAALLDLGSGNGTFVDGRRAPSALLEGGEQIQIGDTVLSFSLDEPPDAPRETVIGARQASRTQSSFHRLVLRRSRRATIASVAAMLAAIVTGGLFAAGVFSAGGTDEAVQRVVRAAAPSTVMIEGLTDGRSVETGTGWVLDARAGLIVTNAHVVNPAQSFRVWAGKDRRDARIVGVAPCEDLAVLRVAKTAGLRSIPLGKQSSLQLGETVVALGFPSNASLEPSLTSTTGVVSVVRSAYREAALDVPHYPNVVQTDAAINRGSSGGPLLNLDGRLVGVNSAGRSVAPDGAVVQGQNYAIGVDRVRNVTAMLQAGRSIGWIGAGFQYPTSAELSDPGRGSGLRIGPPVAGTAAARADLGSAGELLVALDGNRIGDTLTSYCDAIGAMPSGRTVALSVIEPGQSRPRTVRLRLE